MNTYMSSTSFAVIINDGPSSFSTASRGLCQGDPLSPLLFVIAMEALNGLMMRAKELQFIEGVAVGSGEHFIEVLHFFLLITH